VLNVKKPACDVAWMLQVYILYSVSSVRHSIWIIIRLAHLWKTKKKDNCGRQKGRFYRRERRNSTDCGGFEACFVLACKFKHSLYFHRFSIAYIQRCLVEERWSVDGGVSWGHRVWVLEGG
jgi:hypothetical protein